MKHLQDKLLFFQLTRKISRKINVAILMSGEGTNAEVILKNRKLYRNLNFKIISTENPKSNAAILAKKYNLGYYQMSDLEDRNASFNDLSKKLNRLKVELVIYAGFMKIAPKEFVEKFIGLNMHPADLTIKDEKGIPKYRGMNAISNEIKNGINPIRSTLYIVTENVDSGLPIALSSPVFTNSNSPQKIHKILKINGEHKMWPIALKLLSKNKLKFEDLPFANTK